MAAPPPPRGHSRVTPGAIPLASILCGLLVGGPAILSAGCGSVAQRGPTAAMPARSLADQLAAVRSGTASRITAEKPLTDDEWESLRGLAGLRELVLWAGAADDTRADLLATLPDIERLVLRDSPLTDDGFRTLARCHTLANLNVPRSAATPEGIRALAALPHLRSLRLGGPQLAAAGAEVGHALADVPQLRSLHLIDVPIGDAGLAAIARIPQLGSLYLDGAGVSDAAWSEYFEARPEVHVHVDQAHHDRDPRRSHP